MEAEIIGEDGSTAEIEDANFIQVLLNVKKATVDGTVFDGVTNVTIDSDDIDPDVETYILKFAESPKQTALVAAEAGTVGATVRYNLEKPIQEGDKIEMVEAGSEEVFAYSTVKHTVDVPLWKVLDLIRVHGAVYGIDYLQELIGELNFYYDDPIDLDTVVTLIIYKPEPTSVKQI